MSLCATYRAGLDPRRDPPRGDLHQVVGAVETVIRSPKPWPLYILVGLALIYSGKTGLALIPGPP